MSTVTTNNTPRDLMSLCDFSPKQQQQIRNDFDWLEDADENSTLSSCCFFVYRGTIHHLSNFLRVNAESGSDFYGWHGAEADTYFSGTLVKVLDDEQVIVGRWAS